MIAEHLGGYLLYFLQCKHCLYRTSTCVFPAFKRMDTNTRWIAWALTWTGALVGVISLRTHKSLAEPPYSAVYNPWFMHANAETLTVDSLAVRR